MGNYEFIFLTRTELAKEKLEKVIKELESQFAKAGAKIKKREEWGKRDLAYEIRDQKKANFWVWQVSFAGSVNLSPLNTFLNREQEIIRYLFLKNLSK